MSFSLYCQSTFSEVELRALLHAHGWATEPTGRWEPSEDPLFQQDQLSAAFVWLLRDKTHQPCLLFDATFVRTEAEMRAVYRLIVETNTPRIVVLHLEVMSRVLYHSLHQYQSSLQLRQAFQWIGCTTIPMPLPPHFRPGEKLYTVVTHHPHPPNHEKWIRWKRLPLHTPEQRREAARVAYTYLLTPRLFAHEYHLPDSVVDVGLEVDELLQLEWLVEKYIR